MAGAQHLGLKEKGMVVKQLPTKMASLEHWAGACS